MRQRGRNTSHMSFIKRYVNLHLPISTSGLLSIYSHTIRERYHSSFSDHLTPMFTFEIDELRITCYKRVPLVQNINFPHWFCFLKSNKSVRLRDDWWLINNGVGCQFAPFGEQNGFKVRPLRSGHRGLYRCFCWDQSSFLLFTASNTRKAVGQSGAAQYVPAFFRKKNT